MDRFWNRVNKTESCWLWVGSTHAEGYGKVKYEGKTQRAHRVSWKIHYGEIPDGLFVLHKCDVRNCIRPDHLFLGTHNDNMHDMALKGRAHKVHRIGESNPCSKLTEDQVREIRAKYIPRVITINKLAKEYSVSEYVIHSLLHRKTWAHVA